MSLNNIFEKMPINIVFKIMEYNYLETPGFKAIKNKIQKFKKEEDDLLLVQKQIFVFDDEYISLPKITFKEWYFYEKFLENLKNKSPNFDLRYFDLNNETIEREEYFSNYDDYDDYDDYENDY
jgi:hypothetical protein